MLELAGLPILAANRGDGDPLVLVGGAITLLNPEPLADFVDIFAVGEAEGLTEALVDALRATVKLPRPERLEALAQIPGLYIPSLYTAKYDGPPSPNLNLGRGSRPDRQELRVARPVCGDPVGVLAAEPRHGIRQYLSGRSVAGCPYVCRFCTVGFSYPKVRWKPLESLWSMIEKVTPGNRGSASSRPP